MNSHSIDLTTHSAARVAIEGPPLARAVVRRVAALGSRLTRRTRRAETNPGWRLAAEDPAGLQRWWNGRVWTPSTRWDFDNVIRAHGRYYRHSSCTLRHRRSTAAARCASRD
jgi:hypothetical protein